MLGFAVLAHLPADFEPRHPGQHQVEHQQVGRAAADLFDRLRTIARFLDAEAFALEVVADQLADIGLVLDDQHARARAAAFLGDSWLAHFCFLSMWRTTFPLTMNITISAILVAWSAIRSRYLEINKSRVAGPIVCGSSAI